MHLQKVSNDMNEDSSGQNERRATHCVIDVELRHCAVGRLDSLLQIEEF